MSVKVGLTLGSGGLRGLAHVGVLRVLERAGIPVHCIAGCSIGSLIGALYCSGHDADTIHKLAKHLKRRHWLDFVIPKMGVIAGERVLETMRILTRQKHFQELSIPLAVVATELGSGCERVFTTGSVAAAVRASVSVPGVFVPYQLEDAVYVDGAVINPIPADAARGIGADVVIAVDLSVKETPGPIANLFDVMIQSIDIMERQIFRQRQNQCDVLIQPRVGHISPSAFDAIDECVLRGEEAAMEALPRILALLNQ